MNITLASSNTATSAPLYNSASATTLNGDLSGTVRTSGSAIFAINTIQPQIVAGKSPRYQTLRLGILFLSEPPACDVTIDFTDVTRGTELARILKPVGGMRQQFFELPMALVQSIPTAASISVTYTFSESLNGIQTYWTLGAASSNEAGTV